MLIYVGHIYGINKISSPLTIIIQNYCMRLLLILFYGINLISITSSRIYWTPNILGGYKLFV